MNSSADIRVEGLSVDFLTPVGRISAVRNVHLSFAPGEIRGLVGESGSGKSTVALALLGLCAENADNSGGTLTIAERSYRIGKELSPLRGRDISMIFQDPAASLNPVFRIGSHLDEVIRIKQPGLGPAARRRLATDALNAVGFSQPEQQLNRYPHQLSGGLRQRVVIAMALLARPKLLIADEPTTALDVSVEAQVMERLCALRDEIGCAVLLITHSLGLVGRYCETVSVMYAGEVIEDGPVGPVLGRHGHPYTARLLACDVDLDQPLAQSPGDARFQVIAGNLPDLASVPKGCIYAPRCDLANDDCASRKPDMRRLAGTEEHNVKCLLR